jgi:hypothetical protein
LGPDSATQALQARVGVGFLQGAARLEQPIANPQTLRLLDMGFAFEKFFQVPDVPSPEFAFE